MRACTDNSWMILLTYYISFQMFNETIAMIEWKHIKHQAKWAVSLKVKLPTNTGYRIKKNKKNLVSGKLQNTERNLQLSIISKCCLLSLKMKLNYSFWDGNDTFFFFKTKNIKKKTKTHGVKSWGSNSQTLLFLH